MMLVPLRKGDMEQKSYLSCLFNQMKGMFKVVRRKEQGNDPRGKLPQRLSNVWEPPFCAQGLV